MRRVIGVSGKAGLRSGMPSRSPTSSSSESVPASTSRSTAIAVTSLLIEAIRAGSSTPIARCVAMSARPSARVAVSPLRSKATRTRATGSAACARPMQHDSASRRVDRRMDTGSGWWR